MGNTSSSSSNSGGRRRRRYRPHSKKKKPPRNNEDAAFRSSQRSSTSTATDANNNSKHAAHSYVLKMDSVVPEDAPVALRVAREWLRHKTEHNLAAMTALTHPDCMLWLDDETQLPVDEIVEAIGDLYEAFPDMSWRWTSLKLERETMMDDDDDATETSACTAGREQRYQNWSKVVAYNYLGTGHHTGKPFGFGPYEPIASKGTFITDPPKLELILYVQEDKVIEINSDGNDGKMVGPPLFYTQIGGLIM